MDNKSKQAILCDEIGLQHHSENSIAFETVILGNGRATVSISASQGQSRSSIEQTVLSSSDHTESTSQGQSRSSIKHTLVSSSDHTKSKEPERCKKRCHETLYPIHLVGGPAVPSRRSIDATGSLGGVAVEVISDSSAAGQFRRRAATSQVDGEAGAGRLRCSAATLQVPARSDHLTSNRRDCRIHADRSASPTLEQGRLVAALVLHPGDAVKVDGLGTVTRSRVQR